MSIVDLARRVASLPPADRDRAVRLLHVSEETGHLIAPPSMHDWIVTHFGSVAAVERQPIIRTTNLVSFETAVFNPLRALRPIDSGGIGDVDAIISEQGDPFCHPLERTPEDTFGRVRGDFAITASNIAKYGAHHAVVIFDDHHPLHISFDSIRDALDVALEWGRRVIEVDPAARYFFFMWNCLWKAGASIVHGHAQIAAVPGMPYGKIELLRRQALTYRDRYRLAYFADLAQLHRSLGLAIEAADTTIVASLTPVKSKEVLLLAPGMTSGLQAAIARVLDCFIHQLGVRAFNLALYMPPLLPDDRDWAGFPHLVRIVDRGPLHTRTTDVGAMELYAASVVSSDPYDVIDALAP